MEVAERHGRVMGSRLHLITVVDAPSAPAGSLDRAMERTVRSLEHLERCWSRFIASSDISRLNALGADGGTIAVDPSTLTLLAAMIDGHQTTAGRFDPTVVRAVIAEGYTASRLDPTMVCSVASGPALTASLFDLALDHDAGTVSVPPGLALDPGGIGKGLAADLAVARLLGEGLDGAMVEIGGDLAMAGTSPDPQGWLVEVEHPDPDAGVLCTLAVSGGGIATSSVRSRRWTVDGVERHHQIDPRTDRCSTTDLTAVTVVAPTGWLAEVHATAALAAGSDGVIAHLDGHGLSGLAVALTSSGTLVLTTDDLADVRAEVSLHLEQLTCGAS